LSLAVAYSRLSRYPDALQEVQRAEDLGGSPTRVLEVRGSVEALSGDLAAAQQTLTQLTSGAVKGRISPYSIALIYTAMGRKSEALDWLEKAFQEKDTWIVWTHVLVEWDPLRNEPRFQALQKRLNF
jgi:tetratricopeptide (TPR) repeat protein